MPAEIINLAPRKGATSYPDETVSDVADLLDEARTGQAVAVDEPQDTAGKARSRASVMAKLLDRDYSLIVRVHAVPDGDPEDKKTKYTPAVSIKPAKDDDDDDGAEAGAETEDVS